MDVLGVHADTSVVKVPSERRLQRVHVEHEADDGGLRPLQIVVLYFIVQGLEVGEAHDFVDDLVDLLLVDLELLGSLGTLHLLVDVLVEEELEAIDYLSRGRERGRVAVAREGPCLTEEAGFQVKDALLLKVRTDVELNRLSVLWLRC